jgi:autophagy-related protein 9
MFMAGALVAVMAALTIHDAEFLNFEITPDRTALFYLTVLGGIWAAARGSVSEDIDVFNPEYALNNVVEYTRYLPEHWKGRLHGAEILREFSELYKLKWVVLLEELLGAITAPCVMLFSMPKCSDNIVDFFREFTVHVDGLGYVCSFAVFDFKKRTEDQPGDMITEDTHDDYYATKHGKMAASFFGFMDNYVINPKTGIPGHVPAALDHFRPPPASPPLNSPVLPSDTHASKLGHVRDRDFGRNRPRGPGGRGPVVQCRFDVPAQSSPMTSLVLDARHQPWAEARSMQRPRYMRDFFGNAESTRENTTVLSEDLNATAVLETQQPDHSFDTGNLLDESVWETSPANGPSREASDTVANTESDMGILGLIYQLQRAQRPRGGLRI